MKNTILTILISCFGYFVNAQEINKNKNAKVEFQVSGNCAMCKKRIEKASMKVSGVKSSVWNVESGVLKLIINEEKTTVLNIHKAIAKAGHDTDALKANDLDYAKLHACCQYERQ